MKFLKRLFFLLTLLIVVVGSFLAIMVFADPYDFAGNSEFILQDTTLEIAEGEVLLNGSSAITGVKLKEGDTVEVVGSAVLE